MVSQKNQGKYQFNDFEVDLAQRSLRRQGHSVVVSTLTFDLLTFFVLNPQRLVTKEELLAALWPNAEVEESNLNQHIFLLRRALTSQESGGRVIASVPNRGYEFTAAVVALPVAKGDGDRKAAEQPAPRRFHPDEDPPGRRAYASAPAPYPAASKTAGAAGTAVLETEDSESAGTDLAPSKNQPDEGPETQRRSEGRDSQGLDSERRGSKDRTERKRKAPRRAVWFTQPGPLQIASILIILAVVGAGGWLGLRFMHRTHADSMNIVVADFQNTTGNPDFDQALRTALAIDLRQSPYLDVSTRDKVNQTLGQIKLGQIKLGQIKPPANSDAKAAAQADDSKSETQADPDSAAAETQPPLLVGNLARDVCRQLKDNAYLTGQIQPFVLKYLVSVEAINCITGERIAVSKGLANSPDGVLAILDKIAADLRKQLGEPTQSVTRFDKPLFAEGAHSFEALKAYSAASHLAIEGQLNDALPLFQRAVELDPKFTMAFADMGAVYNNLGDKDLAILNLTRAYASRDSVDEPNKLFISAAFHNIVSHDLHAVIRNAEQWSLEYPRDPAPLVTLAELQTQIGKPALAVDPARRSLALNANDPAAYVALARAQMHLGQFEDAAKTCRDAIQRNLDNAEIHGFLLQIAFLNLDQPAIDEQIAWGRAQMPAPAAERAPDPDSDEAPVLIPAKSALDSQIAMMDLAQGKVKAAQAVFARLIAEDRRQGKVDRANELQQELPRMEAELGYPVTALANLTKLREEKLAESKLSESKQAGPKQSTPDTSTDIPVAWAEVGETSRAEAILQADLQARPSDTLLSEYQGPQIRAAIDLNQRDPEAAIDALNPARSYDLRSFDLPALRAQAYMAAKKFEEAEAEFHKILDHSGVEPLSYNYPLAQLGVARALAQQGKLVEASYAYKVVLQIWKDADADMPRLVQAKAEYAKLGGAAIKSAIASKSATASAPPANTNSAIARNSPAKPKPAKPVIKKAPTPTAPTTIDGVPMKAARPYPTHFPAKIE